MVDGDTAFAILVAVPADAVAELEALGIAFGVPTTRGPVLEAVVQVGVGAATVVSLMQTPSTVREFASWIVGLAMRDGDAILIRGRRGEKTVQLRVTGDVDAGAVARFLRDSLGDDHTPPAL